MPERGSVPTPILDSPSAAINLGLGGDLRDAMIKHVEDDYRLHVSMLKRFGKLDNLRYYAMGIIAALGALVGVAILWGPWVLKLAVKDVVEPVVQERSRSDRDYIGARLDAFKASVDQSVKLHETRIEKLETRRPPR